MSARRGRQALTASRDGEPETRHAGIIRVDLHVHSLHSGFTRTLPAFRSRDCYSTPEAIYREARAAGMDLVTLTDHDSIDGCLELFDRRPEATDLVMGEEIECRIRDTGVRVHVGAIGITERLHREVQPLRGNLSEAAEFLRENGVVLVLHHPFHFLRDEMPVERYLEEVLPIVHAVEIRNGMMGREHNDLAAAAGDGWRPLRSGQTLGRTGGSDAHVVRHVARAWTEAPGRNREEFLDSLRGGRSRGAGRHATTGAMAVQIYGVILNYYGGLLGVRRSGLGPAARASALALATAALPFQFIPFLASLGQIRGERRRVESWRTGGLGRGTRGL